MKIEHVAMYVNDMKKSEIFLSSILMENPVVYIIINEQISVHISLLLKMAQDWK